MNTSNALTAVSRDEWTVMTEQASMLVKTGFLPKDINTPEKAIAIMLKGRELNVPAMHALATITVIQGKPTVSPELMAALVERDYGSNALIVEETNDQSCVVSCCKPGWDRRRIVDFTIDEARQAGLLSNQTWQKYPAAMLRSRAISKACKTHFQASIGGMYTPEELGAQVSVVDGEVVMTEPESETVSLEQHVVNVMTAEASPRQIKYLHAVAREAGVTHDDLHEMSVKKFGVGISELNRRQAPQLIEQVQAMRPPTRRDEEGATDEVEIIEVEATPVDDEIDELGPDGEAWGFITELAELDDVRDLAPVKARIKAAGLSEDVDVKNAYNAAYNRLHGVRETSNDAQPALQGVK